MRSAHLKYLNEEKVNKGEEEIVLTVHGIETSPEDKLPILVATVLTVYGMRRRVRDSRGVERR